MPDQSQDLKFAAKSQAAALSVSYITDGMIVGLGTGSTAKIAIDLIGQMVSDGLKVTGVPTSERSRVQAKALNIPLTDFSSTLKLDVTIDGADQVEPNSLAIIKGLGGALLREKIVAFATRRYLIVVDDSKISTDFGLHVPVPVEISQFGWQVTVERLRELGCSPVVRGTPQEPFVTDGGNYIADCHFAGVVDPAELHGHLKNIAGVLECGLFLGLKPLIIVGSEDGTRTIGSVLTP